MKLRFLNYPYCVLFLQQYFLTNTWFALTYMSCADGSFWYILAALRKLVRNCFGSRRVSTPSAFCSSTSPYSSLATAFPICSNTNLQQALAISTVMSVSHKGNSPRRLFRQQHPHLYLQKFRVLTSQGCLFSGCSGPHRIQQRTLVVPKPTAGLYLEVVLKHIRTSAPRF